MNKFEAYKMDGLGNDFIIFDNRKKSFSLTKDQIIRISDRKNIGCDQVIFIEEDKTNEAFLKFYNSCLCIHISIHRMVSILDSMFPRDKIYPDDTISDLFVPFETQVVSETILV